MFEGRPYDEYDAALTESISRFPVDIQPFRDMARPRGAAAGRCWLADKYALSARSQRLETGSRSAAAEPT